MVNANTEKDRAYRVVCNLLRLSKISFEVGLNYVIRVPLDKANEATKLVVKLGFEHLSGTRIYSRGSIVIEVKSLISSFNLYVVDMKDL